MWVEWLLLSELPEEGLMRFFQDGFHQTASFTPPLVSVSEDNWIYVPRRTHNVGREKGHTIVFCCLNWHCVEFPKIIWSELQWLNGLTENVFFFFFLLKHAPHAVFKYSIGFYSTRSFLIQSKVQKYKTCLQANVNKTITHDSDSCFATCTDGMK